jgi:5'-nucleotidase
MQNRRDFLIRLAGSAAALGLISLPFPLFADDETTKLTILHTNDVHSHIDPFPKNHPRWAGMGGVARRAALIRQIRKEEKNVLLLDVGDIFQGTPYFNYYGGELEMKLMSDMGYDASTIGNHEFDNGLDGLVKQLPHASFPLLNANYDFSDTPMAGHTLPYKVFTRQDLKIGVFGLGIELAGLVDKSRYGNTRYLDPVEQAAKTTHLLKKEMDCDLVICLSHLGYKYDDQKISDVVLAKQSRNIDLILGGHTHTFLDEPARYKNRDGKEILVAQTGWAGLRLGRIDYYIQKKSGRKTTDGSSVKIIEKTST